MENVQHNMQTRRSTTSDATRSADIAAKIEQVLSVSPLPMTIEAIVAAIEKLDFEACTGRRTRCKTLSTIDVEEVESILKKRKRRDADNVQTQNLFRKRCGMYFLGSRQDEVEHNLLITREYQDLGMTLLLQRYRYIPIAAEHRFFEYRASTIKGAGHGLFVRRNRMIRCGTVALEYYGEHFTTVPGGASTWLPYMIKMHGNGGYVNGVDVQGRLLSLAPFVNDAGPQLQNMELRELEGVPGKVFIVALRDIFPGEELFATYGAAYWGMKQYEEVSAKVNKDEDEAAAGAEKKSGRRKSAANQNGGRGACDDLGDDFFESGTVCRTCRVKIPRRASIIHVNECSDPMRYTPIKCLNSLPFTQFTSITYTTRDQWRPSVQRSHAAYFVDVRKPLTLFNSHAELEDVPQVEREAEEEP